MSVRERYDSRMLGEGFVWLRLRATTPIEPLDGVTPVLTTPSAVLYTELCHLPRTFISESSMPAAADVVAAPIRKLYPQNGVGSSPDCARAAWNSLTRASLVSGERSLNRKRGPGLRPRNAMYASRAETGQLQRSLSVRPRYTSTPVRNRSVFDAFTRTMMVHGLTDESREMSEMDRCTSGS